MKSSRSRGIYVVTEVGCLDPFTGASQHIKVGLRELEKHFSMEFVSSEHSSPSQKSVNIDKKILKKEKKNKSSLIGGLRDLKYLFKNTKSAFFLMRSIKDSDPDFIYVRAHFLDPLPLFLKVANVPYFIESNGLQFLSRDRYYPSCFTKVSRAIEHWTYSAAQHVFFVGSYGDYWHLKGENWTNVENGVEQTFLSSFEEHQKSAPIEKVHIALIAKLVAHHQPHVLIDAVKKIDSNSRANLCINLIGSGFDLIKEELHTCVEVVDYGFLNRNEIIEHLKLIHVGIIPGGPEYASQMKLFDYGAAKCVALVPRTHNLQHWFDESEVEFFELDNSDSLSKAIEKSITNPIMLMQKGEKLHQRIANDFTWEKVFASEAKVIQSCLSTS